jgi:hypothetical protein
MSSSVMATAANDWHGSIQHDQSEATAKTAKHGGAWQWGVVVTNRIQTNTSTLAEEATAKLPNTQAPWLDFRSRGADVPQVAPASSRCNRFHKPRPSTGCHRWHRLPAGAVLPAPRLRMSEPSSVLVRSGKSVKAEPAKRLAPSRIKWRASSPKSVVPWSKGLKITQAI